MSVRKYLWLMALLWSVSSVAAQDLACPTLDSPVYTDVQNVCADLNTGEACYGNPIVEAELATAELSFESAGSTVPLIETAAITSLRSDESLGISVIDTVAYPPDSWQPFDVRLVGLGNAAIRPDDDTALPTLITRVIADEGANVRRGPGESFGVLTALPDGAYVRLTGRDPANNWLRLQLPDGRTGWIGRGALETDVFQPLERVNISSDEPELLFSPYTTFELETAVQDAPCEGSPESGVLLQTETPDEPLRFRINGREVLIGGTAFLQAQPADALAVYVLEGRAQVDETIADAGAQIRVPLLAPQEPASVDAAPDPARQAPYTYERMAPLPMQLLPRFVYIGIDVRAFVTPRPDVDGSPLSGLLVDDPCTVTTGESGAFLRAGPGREFPVRGTLLFRETARPVARAIGSDGNNWWQLAQNLWISAATTVTGGDCVSVPTAERVPAPVITPTPDS